MEVDAWNGIYAVAESQDGFFTARQAAMAGYSQQLLAHHVHYGRIARVHRGIYRLVHFPATEHEDLVVAWLWSERAGVLSHQTALALHELSDVLPTHVHLTLPEAWKRRRLRVRPGIVLHHADIPEVDRAWFGAVPITVPRRSLRDCALENLSPELLRSAAAQALHRGLVEKAELCDVAAALAPFGGLPA